MKFIGGLRRRGGTFFILALAVCFLSGCGAVNLARPLEAQAASGSTDPPQDALIPLTAADLTDTPTPTFTATPLPTETPTLTPTPTITPTATLDPLVTPQVWRGDLHMHTQCSDGENNYADMIMTAWEQGYSFIAFTDHHWCPMQLTVCEYMTDFLCLPGMEVPSNTGLHLVAVGIWTPVPGGLTVPEFVERVHAQGGIAIAGHPFSLETPWDPYVLLTSGLDAMECPVDDSWPFVFDQGLLPCVYVSDAHSMYSINEHWSTACDVPIRTLEDLKAAIANGQCHH